MTDPEPSESPARTSRTRLKPLQRQAAILVVAEKLFRDQDFHEVSLEDIAEAAGVTRGLLHHYFGSKRGLYLQVVENAVRVPAGTKLLPAGATGDLAQVVTESVNSWLTLIESAGGLWLGSSGSIGLVETDVDQVITDARDDLVDRMVAELPFDPKLDDELLKASLRCFAGFARVATQEWLQSSTLTRAQTSSLLSTTLMALATTAVPAMGAVTQ